MPPKMIWAIGDRSEKFSQLRDDLGKALEISEGRVFSPHVTLGRVKQMEWRRVEPEGRPQVEQDLSLTIPVDSIEIMESVLKKTGPEYSIIQSYSLS